MKTLKQLFKAQHRYMAICSASYRSNVYCPIPAGRSPMVAAARLAAKEVEAKDVILALTDELHEVLHELNWKPWKKIKKPVDMAKVGGEIADCWHFLIELTMLFNLEAELPNLMKASFKKNHDRLKANY